MNSFSELLSVEHVPRGLMLGRGVIGQGNSVRAGKSRMLRVWALDWLVFIVKACSKEREADESASRV